MSKNRVYIRAKQIAQQFQLHIRKGNDLAVSLGWVKPLFTISLCPDMDTLARSHWVPPKEDDELDGYWLLQLHSTQPKKWQRLALAHELGHIYLKHKPLNHYLQDPYKTHSFNGKAPAIAPLPPEVQDQEDEANQFAAYLLVPQSAIQVAAAYGWSRQRLAHELNVPLDLVNLRFELKGF